MCVVGCVLCRCGENKKNATNIYHIIRVRYSAYYTAEEQQQQKQQQKKSNLYYVYKKRAAKTQ